MEIGPQCILRINTNSDTTVPFSRTDKPEVEKVTPWLVTKKIKVAFQIEKKQAIPRKLQELCQLFAKSFSRKQKRKRKRKRSMKFSFRCLKSTAKRYFLSPHKPTQPTRSRNLGARSFIFKNTPKGRLESERASKNRILRQFQQLDNLLLVKFSGGSNQQPRELIQRNRSKDRRRNKEPNNCRYLYECYQQPVWILLKLYNLKSNCKTIRDLGHILLLKSSSTKNPGREMELRSNRKLILSIQLEGTHNLCSKTPSVAPHSLQPWCGPVHDLWLLNGFFYFLKSLDR